MGVSVSTDPNLHGIRSTSSSTHDCYQKNRIRLVTQAYMENYVTNILTEVDEIRWFDHIRKVISEQIALGQQKKEEVSEELSDLMELIANSRGDMDGVERMALKQIASMDDYRKNVAVESVGRLLRMAKSPYYGRVDFQHNEGEWTDRVYIGVFGLHDQDGPLLIHDWRAPICSLFYDYEVGPAEYDAPSGSMPGDVTLKRQHQRGNMDISRYRTVWENSCLIR